MLTMNLEGAQPIQRRLTNMVNGKLDEAIASALNRTIKGVEQAELNAMERSLHQPTPFTMNALKVLKAKPQRGKLDAMLIVMRKQEEYLKPTVFGGTVKTITPVHVRVNKYGNIPGIKGKGIEGIAAKGKRRFVATIRGVTGVWERYGRGGRQIRLLAKPQSDARREKRWDFFGVARKTATKRMKRDMREALRKVFRK